jgi:hypothetical protein
MSHYDQIITTPEYKTDSLNLLKQQADIQQKKIPKFYTVCTFFGYLFATAFQSY